MGGISTTHDANGNLGGYGAWSYAYDAQNRLVSAGDGSTSASFAYDARNRQVSRTIDGVTTHFLWDGWSLVEERDASGNLLADYVHGILIDELISKTNASGTVYYHHDALGSTVALSGETGAVSERYEYDVYGRPAISDAAGNPIPDSAFDNRFLFTGREQIDDIGLYDYRNRVYSADLGRFLQVDPIRFAAGDANMYRYVSNSPIKYFDPTGMVRWFFCRADCTCKMCDPNKAGVCPKGIGVGRSTASMAEACAEAEEKAVQSCTEKSSDCEADKCVQTPGGEADVPLRPEPPSAPPEKKPPRHDEPMPPPFPIDPSEIPRVAGCGNPIA